MNTTTHPSTGFILARMVRKDWDLVRWPMLGYIALSLLALALFTVENKLAFHAALVLLVSVVVIIGATLVFASVIGERTNDTLPFMLSLPVTYVQYSLGKFLFAGGVFFVMWLGLLLGMFALIATQSHLPAGWIPFDLIVMGYLFVCFVLTLSVAMITESNAWSIVTMSIFNVSISIVMVGVATMEDIGQHIEGPVAVWNTPTLVILGAEAAVIIAAVAITLFIQSRKTDFL